MSLELLKLLKIKTNYPWIELKRKLGIGSDEELIRDLFHIVDYGLENFNIESSPVKKHYIEKALHYLNYRGINKMIAKNTYYVEELDRFIEQTHRLISTIYSENRLYLHNKELLERILLALKQSKHKFYKSNYRKQDMKNEKDELFEFVSAMIKNIEDYQLYEELFLEDRDLINMVNSQGYCLLDGVIDQYVSCVKSSHNIEKIHYYQSMIELLMHHSSNRISKELCFSLIDELNQLTFKISASHLPIEERKYRLTYIYEMMKILGDFETEKDLHIQLENTLKKYGIPYENDSIQEALCSNLEPRKDVVLEDHTQKRVYTIDTEYATIYEDALAIETKDDQTILYYYFPLLADYIGMKHPMNKYLEMMSSTIYARGYVKPLLPFDFMKQNLSFDAGQTKRAFTVEVTLDQEKQIQQVKCYRSKINVSQNYSFESFRDMEITPEFQTMIDLSKELSSQVKKLRIKSMKNVIEVYALFCQKALRELAKQNNIPMIYRKFTRKYHTNKLKQLQKAMNLKDNSYVSNLIRVISEQNYSCKVYTLQERKYISFTNPNREYASLLNQRILLQELVDYDIQCYYKDLEKIIQKLNAREIKNRQFQSEYSKLNIRLRKATKKEEEKAKRLTKEHKMIK